VDVVLPFVPKSGEEEVRSVFDAVLSARRQGGAAAEVADRHLFETVVRIHRAGEGAPFTGLKPAGLGHGPVVPVAERAIETGSPEALAGLLRKALDEEVAKRFEELMALKARTNGDVEANRRYVEAMLGLEVWAHGLHESIRGRHHGAEHRHVS
jgi:hypothetical protein